MIEMSSNKTNLAGQEFLTRDNSSPKPQTTKTRAVSPNFPPKPSTAAFSNIVSSSKASKEVASPTGVSSSIGNNPLSNLLKMNIKAPGAAKPELLSQKLKNFASSGKANQATKVSPNSSINKGNSSSNIVQFTHQNQGDNRGHEVEAPALRSNPLSNFSQVGRQTNLNHSGVHQKIHSSGTSPAPTGNKTPSSKAPGFTHNDNQVEKRAAFQQTQSSVYSQSGFGAVPGKTSGNSRGTTGNKVLSSKGSRVASPKAIAPQKGLCQEKKPIISMTFDRNVATKYIGVVADHNEPLKKSGSSTKQSDALSPKRLLKGGIANYKQHAH